MKFPSNIHKDLKNYIYALYDPLDLSELPFYIGRGVGNRVFSHLNESHNNEVKETIDAIKSRGMQPTVKILLHALTLQQAKAAETVAIALLGKDNLANKVKGQGSFTRVSPQELIDHYSAQEVTIKHKAIIIIRNPWDPNATEQHQYDNTRSAWRLGKKKDLSEYALLVHQGIVKRVFTVAAWYPDGTTFHTRNNPDPNNLQYREDYAYRDRFEFVGRLLHPSNPISKLYFGKSVKKYIRASGSPCHYSYNGKGEIYKFNKNGKVSNP